MLFARNIFYVQFLPLVHIGIATVILQGYHFRVGIQDFEVPQATLSYICPFSVRFFFQAKVPLPLRWRLQIIIRASSKMENIVLYSDAGGNASNVLYSSLSWASSNESSSTAAVQMNPLLFQAEPSSRPGFRRKTVPFLCLLVCCYVA